MFEVVEMNCRWSSLFLTLQSKYMKEEAMSHWIDLVRRYTRETREAKTGYVLAIGALVFLGVSALLLRPSILPDTETSAGEGSVGEPSPDVLLSVSVSDCSGESGALDATVEVTRGHGLPEAALRSRAHLLVIREGGLEVTAVSGVGSPPVSKEAERFALHADLRLPRLRSSSRAVIFSGEVGDLMDIPIAMTVWREHKVGGENFAVYLIIEKGGHYWAFPKNCESSLAVPSSPVTSGIEKSDPEQSSGEEAPADDSSDLAIPPPSAGLDGAESPGVGTLHPVREIEGSFPNKAGTVSLNYTIRWRDNNGVNYPLRFAKLEVWDDDTVSLDDRLGSGQTDGDGKISFTGISNSDEFGTLDIYERIWTINGVVDVTDGGDTWEWQTTVNTNIGDGSWNITTTITPGSSGACNIFDSLTKAWQYMTIYANPNPPSVAVTWPDGDADATSYYSPSQNRIYFEGPASATSTTPEPDEWDESVHVHEYGHFIDRQYAGGFTPNYGGNGHSWCSHEDEPTAWGEGWGNFLQGVERDYWNYPNPHLYVETTWSRDLENDRCLSGAGGSGWEDAEGAIGNVLWDVYDSGDELSEGFNEIWTIFDRGTGSDDIYDFWDEWVSLGYGSLADLEANFEGAEGEEVAVGARAGPRGARTRSNGAAAATLVVRRYVWRPSRAAASMARSLPGRRTTVLVRGRCRRVGRSAATTRSG